MKSILKQAVEGFRDERWLTPARMRGYAILLIIAYLLAIITWVYLAEGMRDHAGHPLGTDFLNVYAAGLMTNDGRAPEAYDWTLHGAVERNLVGFDAPYYGWHYPPMFLALAAGLALLPYFWALFCYLGAGLTAYLLVMMRITFRTPLACLMAAAFPGVFINIGNGQNGFITTALLGAGLSCLETQPLIAGVLLGGLAYKPQFFVLIPFVLLISRSYRALIATCGTALVTAGLSFIVLGLKTWQAFFASMKLTEGIILEQGATGWNKIQSFFSLTRMWGGSKDLAYTIHVLVALPAVLILLVIWRSRTTLATKSAALVAAALLFTPYVMDYDLMVLAVPIAFLARQGCDRGFQPYEKTMLTALWILPFLARLIGAEGLILTPFLMMVLLGFCSRRRSII